MLAGAATTGGARRTRARRHSNADLPSSRPGRGAGLARQGAAPPGGRVLTRGSPRRRRPVDGLCVYSGGRSALVLQSGMEGSAVICRPARGARPGDRPALGAGSSADWRVFEKTDPAQPRCAASPPGTDRTRRDGWPTRSCAGRSRAGARTMASRRAAGPRPAGRPPAPRLRDRLLEAAGPAR